jgi:hypothetical protein
MEGTLNYVRFTLYLTNALSWNITELAHRNNNLWVYMSLRSDTLSWYRDNQSLFFLKYVYEIFKYTTEWKLGCKHNCICMEIYTNHITTSPTISRTITHDPHEPYKHDHDDFNCSWKYCWLWHILILDFCFCLRQLYWLVNLCLNGVHLNHIHTNNYNISGR